MFADLLLRASMSPWWMLLAGILIGLVFSRLVFTVFYAELLGWQKRRQARLLHAEALKFARKLDKELADLDAEFGPPMPRKEPLRFPLTRQFVVDGAKLKTRQIKRMIERIVNEDDRRFLSVEGGGNH